MGRLAVFIDKKPSGAAVLYAVCPVFNVATIVPEPPALWAFGVMVVPTIPVQIEFESSPASISDSVALFAQVPFLLYQTALLSKSTAKPITSPAA